MKIRTAEKEDYTEMLLLSQSERWSLTERDIRLMSDAGGGFLVAEDKAQILGMGSYIPYKKYGWIGNVIVRKEIRNHGIGTQIIRACVARLEKRGVVPALFSIKTAEHLYRKCGFIPGGRAITFGGWITKKNIFSGMDTGIDVIPGRIEDVLEFDTRHWGDDRGLLLRKMGESGDLLVAKNGDSVIGYILGLRELYGILYVGPWVADSPRTAYALFNSLIEREFSGYKHLYVDVLVPETNASALRFVETVLRRIDQASEMYFHSKPLAHIGVWGCASLDKG